MPDTFAATNPNDAAICRHCHTRSDWHDETTGACPDDPEFPHPDSIAADFIDGTPENAATNRWVEVDSGLTGEPGECSECGHLHWNESTLSYSTCPLKSEGCTCAMDDSLGVV